MLNSLRTRLIISYVIVVLVCVFVIGLALLVLLRSTPVVTRFDYLSLAETSRAVIEDNPPRRINADQVGVESYLLTLAEMSELRVLLITADRRVHLDSAVLQGKAAAGDIPELPNKRRPSDAGGEFVTDASNGHWQYVVRPVPQRDFALAFLQRPSSPLQFLAENFLATLLQAMLVGVLLSVVMALLIARSVSLPLRRLVVAARQIARGNYDQRVPPGGPTEVRELGHSFNEMTTRVKASQQQQKDFLAGVSHELKTPLTSIQGYSQAIMDDMGSDPESTKGFAQIINDEAERMRRLVVGLLDLARLEAGQSALNREPTDVGTLLNLVAEKLSLRAESKQVALSSEITTLPTVIVDPDRLAQVVSNLMDNAIKHTPAGGKVTLQAEQRDGKVSVAVTDSGKGIPAADLPHVFERFYMVDKSRKAGTGYGLGLAITREIIEAHGGTIQVQSVEGLGSKFTVTLPVVWPGDTTLARRR